MSTKTWLNANYDKVLRGDDTLVNEEIDRLKAENEQLHDKVSELTEALDASHVFSEGVYEKSKQEAIKKACTIGLKAVFQSLPPLPFEKYKVLQSEFVKAMKGE